jgi:hypothetical protein
MSEPYYRISTAQSELDNILYDQANLTGRLNSEALLEKQQGGDEVPKVTRIKASHRFPFRTQYRPMSICANQILRHANSTNNRFTIEYGGEFISRMYQSIDIGIGTVVAAAPLVLTSLTWQYCPNFVSVLLEMASFKVSTDTLYEFTGEMLFVQYSIISPMSQRPALARMLQETTFEFKWAPGTAANGISTYGIAAGVDVSSDITHLELFHPTVPAQAYAATHPAMTVYIPYNLFTMNNIENAYPEVAVYSLNRTLEYNFKNLIRAINLRGVTAVPVSGFLPPAFAGSIWHTWTVVPAITATHIHVEHITLHRDLQQMMALNAHAYMIRQYYKDTESMDSKAHHEIAMTKVIESIYLIGSYNRNIADSTNTRTALVPAVPMILDAVPTTVNAVFPVDPFYMPCGVNPIEGITVQARGQKFYDNFAWNEFSSVWAFFFGKCDNATTTNHCLAPITFALFFYQLEHTGTYNSGWGPNLRITWTSQAFSPVWSGTLVFLVQCINMVLAYRGALTVRYT